MGYNPPLLSDTQAGDAITTTWGAQVIETLEFLNGAVGGNLANDIFNGGFEFDSDSDGTPDFWSKSDNHGTTYPGGTVAIETTSPLAGASSIKMVHPGGVGNGGGLLESDYYDIGDGNPFLLTWLHYATVAGMKNEVIIYWYDKAQVALGGGDASTTIYSSTVNPTSVKQFSGVCNPPATAKYFTIGLVGGFTDTDVAGTAYFDDVYKERIKTRSKTVSGSVSSVDFLDIRDSRKLRFSLYNVSLSALNSVAVRVSADNGATWLSTSTYFLAVTGATSLLLATSEATGPLYGTLDVQNLGPADYTRFNFEITKKSATNTAVHTNAGGLVMDTVAYNAIQFIPTAGTIDTGTIILEELF